MKTGYLRVSTEDQSTNRQIDALESVCDKLYFEQVSACAKSRPVYEQITSSLNPEDTLVVWSVDRAYRSTVDAILEVEKIHKRGANFQILNLNIDTATPDGMLVYTMLAALAQWERATLSERTKQGLAAARRRGKTLGRPRKLSPMGIEHAARLLEQPGATYNSVAKTLRVSERTLLRRINTQIHIED
ncbi:MAG: recombinase family protein [Pseudomonadota bacterium]